MKKFFLSLGFAAFLTFTTMAQCHYVRVDSQGIDTVSFSFTGGSMASYGCSPIDPTFWLSGNGISVTANFVNPQSYPTFRVWGMNDDDTASVSVNGVAYPLNFGTALFTPKVVCGISPGPDGITFSNGLLAGTDPGNYSYQDVQINATGVNSITVTGLAGAGWGFAGVSVDCPLGIENISKDVMQISVYPVPATDKLTVKLPTALNHCIITITDITGNIICKEPVQNVNEMTLGVSDWPAGIYPVKVEGEKSVDVISSVVIK